MLLKCKVLGYQVLLILNILLGCCLVFDVVRPLTSGFIINPIKYLDLDNEESIPKEIQVLKEIIYNKDLPFEFKTLTTWSHFFKPKEYEIEDEVRVLYQCNDNDNKKKDWLITNDYSIINPFLEFDLFNNYVPPQTFLCQPDKTIIGELQPYDFSAVFKFNTYSETSFTISKTYIDI